METLFHMDLNTPALRRAADKSVATVGGIFVPYGKPVEVFRDVDIEIVLGDATLSLQGTIVNIPASGEGFYVQFKGGPNLESLKTKLDKMPREEGAGEEGEEASDGGKKRPTPAWEILDPSSSEPIHVQVRKLTLAEKLKIARTCTRPVREILIRDTEKRIHAEVVRNPKVTDEEIQVYTGMANLSPQVLDWVSKQPKYMRRRAVMLNIIQNPMTPPDTAKKLLSRLNDQELLKVTRSSKVREGIQRHAKKMLMKKGIL